MKALAKCEDSVKYLLPIARAEIAKQLMNKYFLSEAAAAKLLGVSQASISHYMNGERGGKEHEIIKAWKPEIEKFASAAAEQLMEKHDIGAISQMYCDLCKKVGIGEADPSGTRIVGAIPEDLSKQL
jgi:predicted transcriptional regulator